METVVVTGSSGFVGSRLVKLLIRKNYKVFGFDIINAEHNNTNHFTFIKCDVTTPSFIIQLRLIQPIYIFHLAAITDVSITDLNKLSANYLPLRSLGEYVNESNSILIYASTMLVCQYGFVSNDHVITSFPSTPYGVSKYIGELILSDVVEPSKASNVKVARLTTIWGPKMYGNMPSLFKMRKIVFTSRGFNGLKTFSYVDNCCLDLIYLAQNSCNAPGISLIGDQLYLTTNDFIRAVYRSRLRSSSLTLLINIPLWLLRMISVILLFLPKKYHYKVLSGFHLRNLANENIVAPLMSEYTGIEYICFEEALEETLSFYSDDDGI